MAQDGIRCARESLKVFLREALPENDPIPGVGIHPHDAGTYDDAAEETLRSLAACFDSRCQANLTPHSPPHSYLLPAVSQRYGALVISVRQRECGSDAVPHIFLDTLGGGVLQPTS